MESSADSTQENKKLAIEGNEEARSPIAGRPPIAAAETGDARGRQAIEDAFIAGYRAVLRIAAGRGLASSLSAAVLIREQRLEHR